MSAKAKAAALAASAGVLAAGWAVGTANGETATATATTQGGATTGQTTSGATKAATNATTRAASTTAAAAGSYKNGTYTGTTAAHRFGSVTVTVKISGGKITDVTASVLDDGDRKSQNINSQAVPIVKSRVLAANSSNVSTVGGATYTTGAYLTSLQSALSKAGG
ncbi:MAG: FMN-binding protein [Propionibacteriaceae bacterium]